MKLGRSLCLLVAVACTDARSEAPNARSKEALEAIVSEVASDGGVAPSSKARVTESATEVSRRARMVSEQIAARDVRDSRVLAAMRVVPRHELVPRNVRAHAYEDTPLPIGYDQTISQPYIVALMTELLAIRPGDRVLEVGTGSGYQAAVLAEMGADVYTIEIVEPLAERARHDLERIGYPQVHVRAGDGYRGWPEAAPFRAIVVTAAAPDVPRPLLDQLEVGARLVIPVGKWQQELRVITRTEEGFDERTVIPVRFVPMTGRARGE